MKVYAVETRNAGWDGWEITLPNEDPRITVGLSLNRSEVENEVNRLNERDRLYFENSHRETNNKIRHERQEWDLLTANGITPHFKKQDYLEEEDFSDLKPTWRVGEYELSGESN
jgi:hypothetical protein